MIAQGLKFKIANVKLADSGHRCYDLTEHNMQIFKVWRVMLKVQIKITLTYYTMSE